MKGTLNKKYIKYILVTLCFFSVPLSVSAAPMTITFIGNGSATINSVTYNAAESPYAVDLPNGTHPIEITRGAGETDSTINLINFEGISVRSGEPDNYTLERTDSTKTATSMQIITYSGPASNKEASASRTSGVAPLYVHFNADLVASSATERSFHDLDYSWDFDDPTSGTWGTDGKSKNVAKGAVTAHVFEKPGTYSVSFTAKDATGTTIDNGNWNISVSDPEVVYAGTLTTCISDTVNDDFAGCPSGAAQVTTDDIADLSNYFAAGKRLLFHRGSSWNISARPTVSSTFAAATTVGAYGNCDNPNEQGICSNAPVINMNGAIDFISLSGKNDFRLMDISFTGVNGEGQIASGVLYEHDILAMRLEAAEIYQGVGNSDYRTGDNQTQERIAVVDCNFTKTTGPNMYIGADGIFLAGNIFDESVGSHTVRVWNSHMGVISHNRFSGAKTGLHSLKLHGVMEPTIADYMSKGWTVNRSKYIVISDNVFGTSAPWTVGIGPQNSVKDERITDVIFERNKSIADFGSPNTALVSVGSVFYSSYVTIRNNVIDGANSGTGYKGISVSNRGLEPIEKGIRVYNNTVYNPEPLSNFFTGISVSSVVGDAVIKNNYTSAPNLTGTGVAVENGEGTAIIESNVFTTNPYFADPININPLLRDFKLTTASVEAINQGVTVPVFDDFAGQSRNGTYDLGAYGYAEIISSRADVDGSSEITTTDALLTLRNSLGLSMNGTAWQASATTGDVNCDGISNSTDALLILRYSLGLSMDGTGWCE